MRSLLPLALLGAVLLPAAAAFASSIELEMDSGAGNQGGGIHGDLDLDQDGDSSLSVELNRSNVAKGATSTATNQFVLAYERRGKYYGFSASLSGSKDPSQDLAFGGPAVGLNYTSKQIMDTDGQDGEKADLREIYSFGGNLQVYDYKVSLPKKDFNLVQFYPSITFEKPLWDGAVTPAFSAGHYIYSENPALLAAILAGRLGSTLVGSRLNNMLGNLAWGTWQAGLNFSLPMDIGLGLSLEQQQLVVPDRAWTTSLDINAETTFWDSMQVKLDYSHANQGGTMSDTYAVTAGYLF